MARFSTLIIGKDPEKQMEKYRERWLDFPDGSGEFYHPLSRWDYWSEFVGYLTLKNGSTCFSAKKSCIDINSVSTTFSVVFRGKWFDSYKYGWDITEEDRKVLTDEEWEQRFRSLLDKAGDDELITAVACHC